MPAPQVSSRGSGSWPTLPVLLAAATVLTTTWSGGILAGSSAVDPLAGGGLLAILSRLASFLATGLPYSIGLLSFFLAHEMGHYVACRRYRISCSLPHFIPFPPLPFALPIGTFGAIIRIRSPIRDRRALFDVGIAGPLAGFPVAVALVAWGLHTADAIPQGADDGSYLIFGDSLLTIALAKLVAAAPAEGEVLNVGPVFFAGWVGMLATTMNLIPAGQLDGGHIVYALRPSWHRNVSIAAAAFLVGIVVMRNVAHGELSAWLLWAIVVLVFGRTHPSLGGARQSLGTRRTVLAMVALLVLLVSFMPHPIGIS